MGRIELIIGCMFSGKSTEIIRIINKYKVLNKNILVINSKLDNRYGNNSIITHNKQEIECIMLDRLEVLLNTTLESGHSNVYYDKYNSSEIIVIEEAQFFPDLYKFATISADKKDKIIIVAGLSGDFKREPFGDILRLIPHSESIKVLNAFCLECNDGTPAYFTKRIDKKNIDQTFVGSDKDYVAVCRDHYNS